MTCDPVEDLAYRTTMAELAKVRAGTCDPVGLLEIAARLHVKPQTARAWRTRGLLPEPEFTVSGLAAWRWETIAEWSKVTGHPRRGQSEAPVPES